MRPTKYLIYKILYDTIYLYGDNRYKKEEFMKIAIMAAWNTTSGVSMHAEPVGKAFREAGHELTVFTFSKQDFHGEGITAEDEGYVIRCFGTRKGFKRLDPRPFIDHDYEILLVEDLGMLPVDDLSDIMSVIRRKAKTIHVVHENRPCEETWFYKIDWDRIVYFDERQEFLKKVYPDAVHIPYPCYPARAGDRMLARKKLGLPLDKRIVLSFSHRGYQPFYRDLPESLRGDTILLQVIEKEHTMLEEAKHHNWIMVQREEVITTEKFDDYLFACDAAIFHKLMKLDRAVISTSVLQALGTGCPLFVPHDSDFFYDFNEEIVHYIDYADLEKKLVAILGDKQARDHLNKRARAFIESRSPQKIAQEFINLFKELLETDP
jgi:hypothetical protein